MKPTHIAFYLSCLLLFTGITRAQTVTIASTASATGDQTYTPAELGGFSPVGADKLVVTTTDETNSPFSAVTYNGQSLTLAVQRSNGGNLSQIWYLDYDGPATQGDLVLTGGSNSNGVSVLAMTGTADGFVAKASAGSTSIDFDPLYDGSAVVAAFACNGDGDATAQAPLTPLLVATSLGGGSRGGSGYAVVNAGDVPFSSNVANSRPAICIVSFPATGRDADTADITSASATDDGGNPTSSLSTDPVLTIVFDEAIFPGTGNILLKEDGGATAQTYDVSSASQLSFGTDTLTISPDVLEPSTSYFIQIPSGAIEDGSGNTTSYPDTILTFTTGPWLTVAANFKTTYTTTDLRNFDPTGYDKLVVIVMAEYGSHPSSVTWGESGTLTPTINNNNNVRRASMWYLDGPFTGPDELTLAGIDGGNGVSLLALSGTAAGDPVATASANEDFIAYTPSSNDSIVVTGITDNGGPDITAQAPVGITTYFSRDVNSSAGGSGVFANSSTDEQVFLFNGATSSETMILAEFVMAGGGPSSPYESWATGGELFEDDENGDGVSNGLAFLLGAADPDADATGLLPTVTETAGGLVLEFDMLDSASRGTATLNVEHSSDLGDTDPWTVVAVPDSSGGPTSGVTFVVSGSGTLDVTATIGAGEAAGGKLFGRVSATE